MTPSPDGIAVLVPVLGRPRSALPLAVSLWQSEGEFALVFLCSPGDKDEIKAVEKVCLRYRDTYMHVVEWAPERGDYARKINRGVEITEQPWLFQGADDLTFHPQWAVEALYVAHITNRRVIGTNDLGNRRVTTGRHSTHSLVARSYIEEIGVVDEPGKMLHEGYSHNFCDDELIQTATRMGEFAVSPRSKVEHLHPNWGKAALDSTYEKGLRDFHADRNILNRRRALWRTRAAVAGRRRG